MHIRCSIPFDHHAQNFLAKMPVIYHWGAQHIKVMNSTVRRYLIPAFGSVEVSQVGERELDILTKMFEENSLSSFRRKNILRAAVQILDAPDLSDTDPYAMQAELQTQPRKEYYEERWQAHYKAFKAWWTEHKGAVIPESLSFAYWVYKERAKYKDKALPPEHEKLLNEIEFPWGAPSDELTTSNLSYAKLLIAFKKEHGHWAPTASIGGAGLTRWVRLMRKSGGASGIISQDDETAQLAQEMLLKHDPDFNWALTIKREENWRRGLSFNGFQPTPQPLDQTRQRLIARAFDCSRYDFAHIAGETWRSPLHLKSYVLLANRVQQPIRLVSADDVVIGWAQVIHLDGDRLELTWVDQPTETEMTAEVTYLGEPSVFDAAFTNGYWRFPLTLGVRRVYLEIDWLLAEQLVPPSMVVEHLCTTEIMGGIEYLVPNKRRRAITLESTRIAHMMSNILEIASQPKPVVVHWEMDAVVDKAIWVYKYMEHAQRKYRKGELGEFELELLRTMDIHVGKSKPKSADVWIRMPPIAQRARQHAVQRHKPVWKGEFQWISAP